MEEIVPSNISLLELAGKSFHTYNKICGESSFEGLVILLSLIKGRVLSRKRLLWVSKERRRNTNVPHSQNHDSMGTLHLLHL